MAGLRTVLTAVKAVLTAVSDIGVVVFDAEHQAVMQAPVAIIHPPPHHEHREGLGGANLGTKWVTYDLTVEFKRISFRPETDFMAFCDVLDAVRLALRSNQALSGAALRCGEDIDVAIENQTADTTTEYRAVLTTTILEQISG